MKGLIQALGLHPAVALAVVTVDWMLFGSDVTVVGWGLSCAVAMALTVPCVLFQRYAYRDNWGLALAKGIFLGIVTAIPTPLPSILTGAGGLLGLVGWRRLESHNDNKKHE